MVGSIADSQVLAGLIQLIRRSNDRDIYEVAASCLNNLCSGAGLDAEKAREMVVDGGVIPVLTRLVDPSIAEESASMQQSDAGAGPPHNMDHSPTKWP